MVQNQREGGRSGEIPAATLPRLAAYLGVLNTLAAAGTTTISSPALAEAAGVNPAQLRKDLSHLGSYGVRGVGYDVDFLRQQLDANIGSAQDWQVVIIGIGNLGRALVNHAGFLARGFGVVALFDDDESLVGRQIEGMTIHKLDELPRVIADPERVMAVLAVPTAAAQSVCDALVATGIGCILNFAATNLQTPEGVEVRRVDLGLELQILAYHRQMSVADGQVDRAPVVTEMATRSSGSTSTTPATSAPGEHRRGATAVGKSAAEPVEVGEQAEEIS